jgi:diacylglycerol kinase family enzyme
MSPRPRSTTTGPGAETWRGRPRPQLAAVAALVLLCALTVPLLTMAADTGDALIVLGCLFAATYCLWCFATRRGATRYLGLPAAGLAVAGIVSFAYEHRTAVAAWLVMLVLFGVTARAAVRSAPPSRPPGAAWPPGAARTSGVARQAGTSPVSDATARRAVPPARHGVLVVNPLSGGGKAGRLDLVEEARKRGVETLVLQAGDDLRTVVERAIRDGADVVGMAGGDGSQALVAGVAMEHDVAHVCVPAGTRNHFALDLGLDRDDAVGALDAFTDAVERRIDLASVNGRVFVNNASLGVYAGVVESGDYRDAKLGTWRRRLPDLAGPDAPASDLAFDGPDLLERSGSTLILVSNNPYELSRPTVAGTRARLDSGQLGLVAVQVRDPSAVARFVTLSAVGQSRRMRGVLRWTAAAFEVRAAGTVAVGLDGEALTMAPPLRFTSLPGALRVRLPAHAPGISPAAAAVGFSRHDVERLVRIAAGRPR